MFSFLVALLLSGFAHGETPKTLVSPYIENEVLYIQGKIDSHIYDFLTYPNDKMQNVQVVDLDSWGGHHNWALAIAEKIQQRGWATQLSKDQHCASACVYLFGAGTKRKAHSSTWFGIHGARMGAGYMVTFAQSCLDGKSLVQNEICRELELKNYDLNYDATLEAFQLIEISGVSHSLWETYINFDNDPKWYLHFNFLKKPDWVLPASEAINHDLVTKLTNS